MLQSVNCILLNVCVFHGQFFQRERLEKQFYLHLETPPVCAKRQGMEVNSGEEGGEA